MSRFCRGSLVVGLALLGLMAGRRADAAKYTITEIKGLPGYEYNRITGINNAGQIVGLAYNSRTDGFQSDKQGFLISGGVTTEFPLESWVEAVGINNNGQTYGSPSSAVPTHGKINDAGQQFSNNSLIANGQTTPLGGFFGQDINDAGQIAGVISASNGNTLHAAIYQDGRVTDLAATLVGGGKDYSNAYLINNRGDVLYQYKENYGQYNEKGQLSAVRYADGHTQEFKSVPIAMNNLGQVVGWDLLMNPDGTSERLLSLLPLETESLWGGMNASAINDLGQIVGGGRMTDGQSHGFLMTPVPTPEPTTLALLVMAAVGVGVRAAMRRGRRS